MGQQTAKMPCEIKGPYPRDNLEDEVVFAPFDGIKKQVSEFRRLW